MHSSHSTAWLSLALFLCSLAAHAQGVEGAPGLADTQAALPAAAAQATPTAPALTPPRTSNKWRIQFDESSKSDGVISLRVWTQGTTFVDVPVSVRNNQSENSIARGARDAFREVLGAGFKVETDDGEDVLVKARGKTPHFGLSLVGSTAKDVDVELDRE